MSKYKKIVQLVAPASPVYAVFDESKDHHPKSKDDLRLAPCPTLALTETDGDSQFVIGLIVDALELKEPTGSNFLGYAESEEQAVVCFVSTDDE